jgi:hypothetical protein
MCPLFTILFGECVAQPDFGAAAILELRQDDTNAYYIKALIKNNSFYDPIEFKPVTIRNCSDPCPFDDFVRIMNRFIVTDQEKECAIISTDKNSKGLTF